ncbi:MAG: tandem-95 repeat protein, partial [Candidatus Marinimicrobia bacterium]|nr:tandem-95 repeat protein [Candidatus Neomarinimicrobiota bacterium]MBT6867386.1 tandem-95 repeat protein [Candidatus Neomarinimicrobiota bacterium]
MRKILFFIPLFLWTCGGGGGSSPTEPEPPQLPTVQNINLTATEDTPKVFTFVGTDPLNLALSYSVSTQPQNGTVVISGGSGTYTPNANYNGQDIFLYLASSVNGNSNIGTVVIDIVAVDDDPNTMDVSVTTDEDNVVTMTLEAEEVDGQTIQFNVSGNPSNGSVTISGTTATYTPNQDWFGTDTFNFEAVDVASKSILNNATGTITVNPINDAPTVDDINNVEVSNGQSVDITLTGSDVENDNLTFEIVDSPNNGTVSISGNIATFDATSVGSDTFTYKATDGTDESNVATVSINVLDTTRFTTTFGGSLRDKAYSGLQTSDGGY